MKVKCQYEFPLTEGECEEWFRNFLREKIVQEFNLPSFKPRFCFLKYNDLKWSLMAYSREDAEFVETLLGQKPVIHEIKLRQSSAMEERRMEWGPEL